MICALSQQMAVIRFCDPMALQLVSHWVNFVYQASWQRQVSPPSILGLFLTICAQSLTGHFTVNCLVSLPYSPFLLVTLHLAIKWTKCLFVCLFFLEYKRRKLVKAILLARPKFRYRLIWSGIVEDTSSSEDQITGQSAQW